MYTLTHITLQDVIFEFVPLHQTLLLYGVVLTCQKEFGDLPQTVLAS